MSVTFEINGKKLQNIKSAAELTSYSRDYITRLAREKKIVASQIDRQWFVDIESLKQYESVVALEQRVRQQQLSEERKRERQARAVENQPPVLQKYPSRKISARAKRAAVATVALAALLVFVLQYAPLTMLSRQVASAPLVGHVKQNKAMSSDTGTTPEVPVAGAETLTFVEGEKMVAPMSGIENGMLFVPHSSSSADALDVSEFFSDEVTVVVEEGERTYIVRHNERGEVVERIPFMAVPVTSNESP